MSIYSKTSPELCRLAQKCHNPIPSELYTFHDVKRGLRDDNGKGVVAGLTDISTILYSKMENGVEVPCDGILCYRGINIKELTEGFAADNRFGFEETVYLLLFGDLPTPRELDKFNKLLAECRYLPSGFVRDIIMKAPSNDLMNMLARSVLTLYSYDDRADDISIENVLRQSLGLIALFPLLAVYGYQAFHHYHNGGSLFIHAPNPELSTAENILYMLRSNHKFTDLEAKILDLALVLHAEHGGGNNSSFTTHVITSSGTDTYSAISGALGSLKGPRHGGANIKVVKMMADIKDHVADWNDDEEISAYLLKLLRKEAFDRSGLIYGMGHAVYTVSDPRALILKEHVKKLSDEKGRQKEFEFYSRIERLAPEVINSHRKSSKLVSANIDFYSGFVYSMLDLPLELYTPIFAIARIAGWSAHRLEELSLGGKIIRPGYTSISEDKVYIPLSAR
ncbi:MAG: citrate/2-methylcitrate synthase [Oscillospiraceae bacterium]|nr:citrate/2-methylcitrate synthase [Oscillospiraceae bacterium]